MYIQQLSRRGNGRASVVQAFGVFSSIEVVMLHSPSTANRASDGLQRFACRSSVPCYSLPLFPGARGCCGVVLGIGKKERQGANLNF